MYPPPTTLTITSYFPNVFVTENGWFTITFKNGRTLHCEYFYSFKSKEIVDTENGTMRFTNKMDLLKEFIDNQLEHTRKKYEK